MLRLPVVVGLARQRRRVGHHDGMNAASTTGPGPLAYFAVARGVTDPGRHRQAIEALPADVAELVPVVQGLMVHIFWAEPLHLELSEERKREVDLRTVERILDRVLDLDDRPLDQARPLDRKVVGNCRDHTVLMAAILRAHGIPARARCGFGRYFVPNHFEDHWVCEYWDADAGRWRLVDAQLDAFQRAALNIDFDPLDVPRDRFLSGGEAWQRCRDGRADPMTFGIEKMRGLWFVRGDLVRDFLAMNKVDILPWDHGWGHLGEENPDAYPLMDRMARMCAEADASFDEIRALFAADPGFAPPPALRE